MSVEFHATPSVPMAAGQCSSSTRAGNRCRRFAIRGATVCLVHGGRLPVVRDAAADRVAEARAALFAAAPRAASVLAELLDRPETPDAVRVRAAAEILSRSGIKPGAEVDLILSAQEDPSAILRHRLAVLAARTKQSARTELES